MIACLMVLAIVAIIALVVTIHNISDGLRKAKKELDRGVGLDNSEYDYGHDVKHTSDDE